MPESMDVTMGTVFNVLIDMKGGISRIETQTEASGKAIEGLQADVQTLHQGQAQLGRELVELKTRVEGWAFGLNTGLTVLAILVAIGIAIWSRRKPKDFISREEVDRLIASKVEEYVSKIKVQGETAISR